MFQRRVGVLTRVNFERVLPLPYANLPHTFGRSAPIRGLFRAVTVWRGFNPVDEQGLNYLMTDLCVRKRESAQT